MAGTGGFGYLIARGLDDRATTLRRLIGALQHLESDITFACLPITAALNRAAQTVGSETGAFLLDAARAIGQNDGAPLAAAWSGAVSRHEMELMLAPAEAEALVQLGAVLGGSDREDQRQHLTLARATLSRFESEAVVKAGKTKRIWQYLGFSLGGLAVVLLY